MFFPEFSISPSGSYLCFIMMSTAKGWTDFRGHIRDHITYAAFKNFICCNFRILIRTFYFFWSSAILPDTRLGYGDVGDYMPDQIKFFWNRDWFSSPKKIWNSSWFSWQDNALSFQHFLQFCQNQNYQNCLYLLALHKTDLIPYSILSCCSRAFLLVSFSQFFHSIFTAQSPRCTFACGRWFLRERWFFAWATKKVTKVSFPEVFFSRS